MKLRTLVLVAFVLFVGLTSATTAGIRQQRRAGTRLISAQPTDTEVINLWYMRQEEKLARDVYLTLYEQWGTVTFANISESEQRHMDAIKRLIDLYNIEDPVEGKEIGEYADQVFTDLYQELTELGAKSLTDAFSVGVTIEELDISDLKEKLEDTTSGNVKRVFENLLAGSERHLAAFQKNIENYNPESLQTCVNGGMQRQARNGQGGKGQGGFGHGRNRQGGNGQGRNGQGSNCDGTCINSGICQQACDQDGTCINQ